MESNGRIKLEIQILGLGWLKKLSNYNPKAKEKKEQKRKRKKHNQPAPGALGSGNPICT